MSSVIDFIDFLNRMETIDSLMDSSDDDSEEEIESADLYVRQLNDRRYFITIYDLFLAVTSSFFLIQNIL